MNTHERFEFSRIGAGEDEFTKAIKDAKTMIKVMKKMVGNEAPPVTFLLSVSVGDQERAMPILREARLAAVEQDNGTES